MSGINQDALVYIVIRNQTGHYVRVYMQQSGTVPNLIPVVINHSSILQE